MSLKLNKLCFALNLFSKADVGVIPRKQQYCSLLVRSPPAAFTVLLLGDLGPFRMGGCVQPAGRVTQGEAGADEDRVTDRPPLNQGALQREKTPLSGPSLHP